MDKRLQWTPTLQVRAGLDRLEELGLYGDSLSQIVNHILTKEIACLLEAGLMGKDGLDAARKQVEREWSQGDAAEKQQR